MKRQHWAVIVLVAIPTLAFVLSAALGHMSINGDNGLQNFPLRALAASDLDSGHLPLWDPYLWSGTPLLASFNAGAVYPLTLLFAILPSIPAWVLTQIALYSIAAVGTFVFFRSAGRSVAASMAAAVSFAFAGFLSSQIGHVDAIEAAVWLPWLLFALRRLALSDRHRGVWTALLGLMVGIVVVSASPNTIVDDLIAVGFYGIWLAIRHRDRVGSILGLTIAAGVVGLLLGGVLFVPGLAWESQSQRAGAAFGFFASGSLPPRLTILQVLPWLIGGNGKFGGAYYAGPYNLSELNGYIGLFPLIAGCGLLARRFRRHPLRGDWLGWYVLVALGLVLSWGGHTPVGHLLYHIPFYGQLRDQSRSLILVDLGLAGLLASWVDVAILPLRARSKAKGPLPAGIAAQEGAGAAQEGAGAGQEGAGAAQEGSPRPWPARLRRTEVAWALLPVIGILVVWVYFLVDPGSLAFRLGARGLGRIGAGKVDLTIAVVIALGAAAAVIGASRIKPALRVGAIGGVIAIDLLVYGAQQYTFDSTPTAQLQGRTLPEKALAAAAGPGRRIAFDDPGTLPSLDALEMLGLPDDNILEGVSSANGYGSLVNATYDKLTGAHANVTLDLGAIGNGTLDQLDVGILATPGPTLVPPDQALSAQLAKGGWVAAGTLDGYSLWRPTHSLGPLWTIPVSPGPKVGNLHRGQQDAWSAAISTAAPTEVVRSVAYAPGWSAVVSGPSIGTRTVPVVRQGLVQGTFVPAGVTHITWRYNPPGLTTGIALTALGALAMASLAIADPTMGVLSRRRRRKDTR